MSIPDVSWGSRDTSGLAHEQIHRWVHDGADPAALADARDRHAARGEELRAAARRLEAARSALGEGWAGRDADAAAARVRGLGDRMLRLGDDLAGQARGLDGLRAAVDRVRAAVGPPRGPALGPLSGPSALADLPRAAAGLPVDGFGAFHGAHTEEIAARSAYRAYLAETALAARSAPVGSGAPALVAGAVEPGRAAPAPGPTRPWAGALARAAQGPAARTTAGSPSSVPAGPVPARPSGPASGAVASGAVPSGAVTSSRPPGPAFGAASPGTGVAGPPTAPPTARPTAPPTAPPAASSGRAPAPGRAGGGFVARVAAALRRRSTGGSGSPAPAPAPHHPDASRPALTAPARYLVPADGDDDASDGPVFVVPPVLGVEPDRPRGGPR